MSKGKSLLWMTLSASITCARIAAAQVEAPVKRPYIWVTADERPAILARVGGDPRAAALEKQLNQKVDPLIKKHAADPESILKSMPAFKGHAYEHRAFLDNAVYSAVLFYLTEKEEYARFSADILNAYIRKLSEKDPKTTTIIGPRFEDCRWTYPNFAMAYDLVYPFLTKRGTVVYDSVAGEYTPFDNVTAQKVIYNMASRAVGEFSGSDQHGREISNHHLLTASGALYTTLCIDDPAVRERLFEIFWDTGSRDQASMLHTIIPMFSRYGQGILPESTSYGGMSPLGTLETIDRVKPELNALSYGMEILEGRFMFPQMTHPDGTFIRYGDSKRYNGSPAAQMRQVRRIAHNIGAAELRSRAESFLKLYPEAGGPEIDGYQSCGGIFRVPPPPFDPGSIDETGEIKRTVLVKHAGVALVRNYVDKDNQLYGLNGYIGGAHYVHSHCTGIGMELYGAGYIMGPGAGMPPAVSSRKNPVHANYARLYAGNNTVIVNGTSHGTQKGAWKSQSNIRQDDAVNVACEPGHLEDPVCGEFGFATQLLKDTVNDCLQQRTLAVIRTGPTSGYYLDVFRSRSNAENKFHDYIYHNIGDAMRLIFENRGRVVFTPTDKYDNDIGDIVESPGWRFFEEETTTPPVDKAVWIPFQVKQGDRYMHMFVPGGVAREYTKAIGPPTPEAKNHYYKKKTQIIAVRQAGEAWDRPFAVVFEPALNVNPTVRSVEHIMQDGRLVGVEVKSVVDDVSITDLIITLDEAGTLIDIPERDLKFQGRFAIVRTERGDQTGRLSLYIGEGSRLGYGKTRLEGDEKNRGFKVVE